ncbi:hypothetical protein ACFVYP_28410 [Kitasatospora sp. NPDC058201]|uniref:hypothetical protein n=1 Tax=unclassified Kitasatospora TaxID=2633591 RepID=UPI00364E3092
MRRRGGRPGGHRPSPHPPRPQAPARDLLKDLLTGIHDCWLLHSEYDDLDTDEVLGDAEDWDDEQAEEHQRRSRDRFAQLLRDAAAANGVRFL